MGSQMPVAERSDLKNLKQKIFQWPIIGPGASVGDVNGLPVFFCEQQANWNFPRKYWFSISIFNWSL
jgi:hypothetical protein